MKKSFLTFKFILYSFLVAFLVNTIVVSAHLLSSREFTFSQSVQVILFSLGVSALFFAVVCVGLFLVASLLGKMNREQIFWILMLIGIVVTVTAFMVFENIFDSYTDKPGIIAAIAAFAIMVSLASQYQFFIDPDYSKEHGAFAD